MRPELHADRLWGENAAGYGDYILLFWNRYFSMLQHNDPAQNQRNTHNCAPTLGCVLCITFGGLQLGI
jgi:hypothetical protein